MAGILRGEIRWAQLSPTRGREQAGYRPVVILSHDIFNEKSGTVITVPVTSQPQKAGFPLTLPVNEADLPKQSWIKISQVRTLSVDRIGEVMGKLAPLELSRVIEGLNEIIA